jgi:hypothetical protein
MRLEENPLLPSSGDYSQLNFVLSRLFRAIAAKVNGLADGRLAAIDNALTAAPTSGTWAKGDFVRNSAPAEAGVATSKYVVYGFLCTVGGTPGTWVQCRFLTGN